MMREIRVTRLMLAISLTVAAGSLSAEGHSMADVMGAEVRAKMYESSAAEAQKRLDYLKAKAALERYESSGAVSLMPDSERAALLKAERERISREMGIPLEDLEREGSGSPSSMFGGKGMGAGKVVPSVFDAPMAVIEVFRRNGQTIARLNTINGPTEVPVGGEIEGWKVVKATVNGVTLKQGDTGAIREIY